MKDFYAFAVIEIHRFFARKNMITWLILLALFLIQANNSISNFKKYPEKIKTFKQIQKKYFERTPHYELYSRDGIKFLFLPSPSMILSDNTVVSTDLSAKVDSLVTVNIYNNFKGKSLVPGTWSGQLDITGIISWLVTLLALWYGFGSFHSREYGLFLSSIGSHLKTFLSITIPRLFLFLCAFIFNTAAVYIFARVQGIEFSAADHTGFLAALTAAGVMIIIFYFIGVIISTFGQKIPAFIALLAAWGILNFGLFWAINANAEPRFPDATRDYQTELDKYGKLMNFEKRAEDKIGKFNRNNIEKARRVIEKFKEKDYKDINAVETGLKEEIRQIINDYNKKCLWFTTGFFRVTAHEASSRGYINFLLFYDYVQDMQRKFVWFYIERTFYNDPKIMVNFIRDNESIFQGRSCVPNGFLTGLAINLGYVVILFFLAYFRFMQMIFPGTKEPKAFSSIHLDLETRKITTITSGYADFNRQLSKVFAGRSRGLKWKVKLDGVTLIIGKKHFHIYIPNPVHIPPELKARHLLALFIRIFKISPKEREISEKPGIKELLKKRFQEMTHQEKAIIMINLAEISNKALHIYDDFARGLPHDSRYDVAGLVHMSCLGKTTVIDIDDSASYWLNPDIKITIGYRKGEYKTFYN